MKIKCSYCDSLFDDTLAKCPSCGAPNEGVVRKSGDQPITIDELAKWYKDHGLPPYETTRFFIGIDCKEPRAFGIYKDSTSGNFIVYKNKDNGQRAVRYAGTDEAYAVNELFQRLKQEIIQQKMHNVKSPSGTYAQESSSGNSSFIKSSLKKLLFLLAFPIVFVAMSIGLTLFEDDDYPLSGYYKYNDNVYYCYGVDYYEYDKDNSWEVLGYYNESIVPSELQSDSKAKEYYLGQEWTSSIGCTDFLESVAYKDATTKVKEGYYQHNNDTYYHIGSYSDYGWYMYDDNDLDWKNVSYDILPSDLQHPSRTEDFYYTDTWNSSIQASDFTDSDAYYIYESEEADSDSWDNSSDDSDYSWDSSDSWDSDFSDWGSDW